MAYEFPERDLFSLLEEPEYGDLNRLIWILEILPAENLIETLDELRKGRRPKNPNRRMWYCMVASMLYTRGQVNPLIAELHRNPTMRQVCHIPCVEAIPSRHAFKRFRGRLERHKNLLREMFNEMVEALRQVIPELGRVTAADGTGLRTHRRAKDEAEDGSYGKKRSVRVKDDGTEEEVTLEWFGFKLHLVVDAETELPLGFRVTRANDSETKHLVPLMKEIKERHPGMELEVVTADKGYDDGKNHERLWEGEVQGEALRVKAVIPKRTEPNIEEETLLYDDGSDRFDLKLGENGGLECWARVREGGKWVDRWLPMSPTGFEADRCTQKFRCPAMHEGLHCPRSKECNAGKSYGRVVRVPCKTDWRRIPTIQIGTPKWKRLYRKRTSVERCFGRLKSILGLGDLAVWRKGGVEVQVHLGMMMLLASALWHVNQGRQTNLNRMSAARLAA